MYWFPSPPVGTVWKFGGLGSNPGEGMDVRKRIVPMRHEGIPKNCRVASPLVRLGEGEERWKTPDRPQGVLPQNWCGTEL
ncbi:hypothetical protein TNCV_280011 [Trichonephila clavipes]|nr:hypothetical protein TNCV_280011 [Trichonephila clavipes]